MVAGLSEGQKSCFRAVRVTSVSPSLGQEQDWEIGAVNPFCASKTRINIFIYFNTIKNKYIKQITPHIFSQLSSYLVYLLPGEEEHKGWYVPRGREREAPALQGSSPLVCLILNFSWWDPWLALAACVPDGWRLKLQVVWALSGCIPPSEPAPVSLAREDASLIRGHWSLRRRADGAGQSAPAGTTVRRGQAAGLCLEAGCTQSWGSPLTEDRHPARPHTGTERGPTAARRRGMRRARPLGRPLLSARRGLAPACPPLSAGPGGRGGRGSPCGAASRAEGQLAAPIRCRGRETPPSAPCRALPGGLGSVPGVPSKVGCGGTPAVPRPPVGERGGLRNVRWNEKVDE